MKPNDGSNLNKFDNPHFTIHNPCVSDKRTFRFTRDMRLKLQNDFDRVLESPVKFTRGPLLVFASKSPNKKSRMGIRISRRVGSAVERNRIKRYLREAFRLMQHDWPMPVDLVLSVRPHEVFKLAEYQKLMSGIMVNSVTMLRDSD